ncbi:hypothetical protein [Reinekea sp.]|uniref:hypothetical protein n=1 Tax=Reinekea sp. TaxID=1970455 RepID=UPI003988C42A
MGHAFILNEASLPFNTVTDCHKLLPVFFRMISKIHKTNNAFYSSEDEKWSELEFSLGFSLGEWLAHMENNELRQVVKAVLRDCKCPSILSVDKNLAAIESESIYCLGENQDIETKGLGLAAESGSVGVSFSSSEMWKKDTILVTKVSESDLTIEARNVFDLVGLGHVISEFSSSKRSEIDFLSKLNVSGNVDFPRLVFCESVLRDFQNYINTPSESSQVLNVLSKLDSAIEHANSNIDLISTAGLTISGESTMTMTKKKFARKREFLHPESGLEVFELHVKNFENYKRMHILPNYSTHTICIGYFGRHLPTYSES